MRPWDSEGEVRLRSARRMRRGARAAVLEGQVKREERTV